MTTIPRIVSADDHVVEPGELAASEPGEPRVDLDREDAASPLGDLARQGAICS